MGVDCSNLTYVDSTLDEYVWKNMGPRCVDRSFALPAITVYGIILLMGLSGNLCTCLVIIRNTSMHTATNYYLFSLAMSDVLMLLLGLPFEMHGVLDTQYPYTMPEWLCKMRGFLTEVTSYASILCITAFSAERWLAICFPLKAQLFSKFSRAVKVIAAAWTLAFLCAVPVCVIVKINRLAAPPYNATSAAALGEYRQAAVMSSDFEDGGATMAGTEFCALDQNNFMARSVVLNFSFYMFFVAPMLTISVLYIHIALRLRVADRYLKGKTSACKRRVRTINTRRSVLRMLIAVVIAFFVCWLPFHVQRLSTIYLDWNNLNLATHNFVMAFYSVSGFFYYANSAVNPLIYNIVSRKFRVTFICTIFPKSFRERFKFLAEYDSQGRTNTLHSQMGVAGGGMSGVASRAHRTHHNMPLMCVQSAGGYGSSRAHNTPRLVSTASPSPPAHQQLQQPTGRTSSFLTVEPSANAAALQCKQKERCWAYSRRAATARPGCTTRRGSPPPPRLRRRHTSNCNNRRRRDTRPPFSLSNLRRTPPPSSVSKEGDDVRTVGGRLRLVQGAQHAAARLHRLAFAAGTPATATTDGDGTHVLLSHCRTFGEHRRLPV